MTADKPCSDRILVIDDMAELHRVFRKLLSPKAIRPQQAELEASLFGAVAVAPETCGYQVDSALQGEEGLALVRAALAEGRPYALAFIDMRMPPGWDGLQTIEAIWRVYPELEVVVCTAHADYSDVDMLARLGRGDQLQFLRKPFGAAEVRHLARTLTDKWRLRQEARLH